MNRIEVSEIVIGLVLAGKIAPGHYNLDDIDPMYRDAAKLLQKGTDPVELMDKVGTTIIMACKQAAAEVDPKHDWIAQLEKSAAREVLAEIFEKEAKKLRQGKDMDASKVQNAIQIGIDTRKYITLDKVPAEHGKFVTCGFDPIDRHVGGLPASSLIVIAGLPGVGKTSLGDQIMLGLSREAVKKSADTKVLDYSLEMTLGQAVARFEEIGNITKEEAARIIGCDQLLNIDELCAEASRIATTTPLIAIFIDFADLLVEEEETEQNVGRIYRKLEMLAKRIGVPVVLISQLGRAAVGGIPRIHHIRWSGLAEATAALICMIYNPNSIWADQGEDDSLPIVQNCGYMIVGKSRFGTKEKSIGAVQIEWHGETGWGDKSLGWYPLMSVE